MLIENDELKKLERHVQTQFRYQAKAYVDFCVSIRTIVVGADGKIKDPVTADKVQQSAWFIVLLRNGNKLLILHFLRLLECTKSALLKGADDKYAKVNIEEFDDQLEAVFKDAADAVDTFQVFGNVCLHLIWNVVFISDK